MSLQQIPVLTEEEIQALVTRANTTSSYTAYGVGIFGLKVLHEEILPLPLRIFYLTLSTYGNNRIIDCLYGMGNIVINAPEKGLRQFHNMTAKELKQNMKILAETDCFFLFDENCKNNAISVRQAYNLETLFWPYDEMCRLPLFHRYLSLEHKLLLTYLFTGIHDHDYTFKCENYALEDFAWVLPYTDIIPYLNDLQAWGLLSYRKWRGEYLVQIPTETPYSKELYYDNITF